MDSWLNQKARKASFDFRRGLMKLVIQSSVVCMRGHFWREFEVEEFFSGALGSV
jgi:hypothetical protein